ncbi:MAG: HAD-IB family hydrolase, partial [Phyllobacteriaceae bacterium]|nr:HAD-IB family hydrolase [Phyllobacteriaceae bacterium]
HYASEHPGCGLDADAVLAEVRAARAACRSRVEINDHYYATFAGQSRAAVRASAERLVEAGGLRPKPMMVDRLEAHRRDGDGIVVVSGSSRDIIEPLLRRLGITDTLCAEPETRDGRYTGRLLARAIGPHKAERLRDFCAAHHVDRSRCTAYGDDISDAPMLSEVGRSVAVDPEPRLAGLARDRGWEILTTR